MNAKIKDLGWLVLAVLIATALNGFLKVQDLPKKIGVS